jgi:hypothetical protein
MTSAGQFDILLQFHQTAIQDLQHRILNASLPCSQPSLWVSSKYLFSPSPLLASIVRGLLLALL